tara:strand:- start:386 stop:499 length:114 start_codon:yes stop_codon:yes gene_type:complete
METTIIAIIIAAMIGFAAGMYLVTQIGDWINRQIKKK